MIDQVYQQLQHEFQRAYSNDLAFSAFLFTTLLSFLYLTRAWFQKAFTFIWKFLFYTVEITNETSLFYWLEKYSQDHLLNSYTRKVFISTTHEDEVVTSPGNGSHIFWFGGVPMLFTRTIESAEVNKGSFNSKKHQQFFITTPWLFKSKIQELIKKAKETKEKEKLKCLYADKYGGWQTSKADLSRRLDTVIVSQDAKDKALSHLDYFNNHKEQWTKFGRPWRTGILLSGPPGNGKTSFAKAILLESSMGIATCSLGDSKMEDYELLNLVSCVPNNHALVLEDIDCVQPKREKDDDGITLSGLLNALDGIHTPPGLVVIMTTNYPEKLDPALVRDGRVDIHIEITSPTGIEMKQMLDMYYPENNISIDPKATYKSMAAWENKIQSVSPEILKELLK